MPKFQNTFKVDPSNKKKIAIVGMGAIGTTFAFEFANIGHEVTAIARGKRLDILKQDMNSLTRANTGETVKLHAVFPRLDSEIEYDYVIVCVMAHQVDSLLPDLKASKAKEIGFFYNTFDAFDKLIDAVGKERFVAGFPSITARIEPDNKIFYEIQQSGMVNTMNEKRWETFFKANKIPATTTDDMLSWARAHVAFACGFLSATAIAYTRDVNKGEITSEEARILAKAIAEGFEICKKLGNKIIPFVVTMMSKLPVSLTANFLKSGAKSGRHFGVLGFSEPRIVWQTIKKTYSGPTPSIDAALELINKNDKQFNQQKNSKQELVDEQTQTQSKTE